jgi:hypothetical protein
MTASFAERRGARLRRIATITALAAITAILPSHILRAQGPTAAAETPSVPDAYRLNMLIRTTLIALNHANRTGNYTVLRDLASPAFQRTNNAARLAEIFAVLRKRDLDLSPILFFQPKLRSPAALTNTGLLRLTGFFETKPEQISFDMLFQQTEGNWRLFGLAVDVAPPTAAEQPPAASAPEQSSAAPVERSSVEPAVERNSARLPRRAAVPAPSRRPAQQAQVGEVVGDTTDDDAIEGVSDEGSGSVWSLWGN